ncbi:hypothetical protein [Mucilaginibacter sp. SP1R1]|uniref:hypothetical protein n=1 Tax=Mucilaginibacter sp. SP1R1 TaxID=2723091 RepID=UPI00161531CA|nr:hypothetical protein [Mucilaginibacter sp. SP1R1]MBB6149621.1 hypothetical protein [Mucilaginibacter sp. SP1R1]
MLITEKSNNKPMHIAYSAMQQLTDRHPHEDTNQADQEILLRYEAYQAACIKYNKEISDIQKYIPGWLPAFR